VQAPEGYVVVSELSWLRPDLPEEAITFMKQGYPAIKTLEENLEVAQKSGYRIVGSFVLPAKSWRDNYYTLIETKLPSMKARYKDDKEALQFIACEETEIEVLRKYSDYYGYVFYIMKVEYHECSRSLFNNNKIQLQHIYAQISEILKKMAIAGML